jgi:hypothetical protein
MAPLAVHPEKYEGDLQFFRAPEWSPTGRHIAYLAEGVYGYSSLVVHTLGATHSSDQAVPIDMLDDYGWPAWSPDGKWLAYRQALFQSESALPVESIRLTAPGTTRSHTIIVKSPRQNELWRVSHPVWNSDSASLMVRVRVQESERPGFTAVFDAKSGRLLSSGGPAPQFWRQLGGSQGPYWIEQLRGNRCRLRGSIDLTLPSDDYDVSPNGRFVVFHDPLQEGPAAKTTLRVLKLPSHR